MLQAGYQDLVLSAVCLQRNCQVKAPMAMLQSVNHPISSMSSRSREAT